MKQNNACESTRHTWKLFVDGASRNNPGLAGVGIYILKDDLLVEKHGFFIGIKTNNQAEYLALLIGLFYLEQYVACQDEIIIMSDSELMVKQLKGLYKVTNLQLLRIFKIIKNMLNLLCFQIIHIRRVHNAQADKLANYGIDHSIKPPDWVQKKLHEYELST